MILEKFINFIDKNYHHKRLVKFLNNYKIDLIIDVESHKGNNIDEIDNFLTNNQFHLIKKFHFPTFHFEDRLYKKRLT